MASQRNRSAIKTLGVFLDSLHLADFELGGLDLFLRIEHWKRVFRLRDILLDPLHRVLLHRVFGWRLAGRLAADAPLCHPPLEEGVVLSVGDFVV